MSELTLWIVALDDDDWKYDEMVETAVWAESAEQAEALVRAEVRDEKYGWMWVKPEWRLHVRPAPSEGVVLVHWHAG